MFRNHFVATLAAVCMTVAAPAQALEPSGVCHFRTLASPSASPESTDKIETLRCKIIDDPSKHLNFRIIWGDGVVRNYSRSDRQSAFWIDDNDRVWQHLGGDMSFGLRNSDMQVEIDAVYVEMGRRR